MSEKLSALMDNELSELDERRLLKELEGDAELRATWDRYHVMRAALRKEDLSRAPVGVADAVARALGAEPERRRSFTKGLGKWAGGFAIAASVATVAVLSVQSLLAPKDADSIAQTTPAVSTVAAKSEGTAPVANSPLNTYLVEHGEVTPSAGMGNMLPYVRTVNHEKAK
ncbi:MAG TPA: sigma-E factor negative regulatory protein [Burkholderiales bacterium]|nr:sigma-E factor negative regulatory protein [Burkholderiales bacterium]